MSQAVPQGHKGLIPHLTCESSAEAIEFYKQAFGAVEISRMNSPDSDKIMHAALSIDGHLFFLADDFPEHCGGKSRSPKKLGATPVTIHRYVDDCDAAMARAEKAGATVILPATDMFWGDRYGVIEDPSGHQWSLATHLQDLTPEEIHANMIKMCAEWNSEKQ